MSRGRMVHFLLAYDHAAGELLHQDTFHDANKAAAAYAQAEERYRGNDDMEIVLVGADSIETIQITHGQYFASSPLASKYLSLA